MVNGIGIDMVSISSIRQMAGDLPSLTPEPSPEQLAALNAFVRRTFSTEEVREALTRPDPAEHLAGCFGIKEAVFKALAPQVPDGFDLRIIHSVREADGSPHVVIDDTLRTVLDSAGISEVLISVSHEDNYAIAMAYAMA